MFIEDEFSLKIDFDEMNEENFETLNSISNFIIKKK